MASATSSGEVVEVSDEDRCGYVFESAAIRARCVAEAGHTGPHRYFSADLSRPKPEPSRKADPEPGLEPVSDETKADLARRGWLKA